MNDKEFKKILKNGCIFLDVRALYSKNVKNYIEKLVDYSKQVKVKLMIGLIISKEDNESLFQNIILNNINFSEYFFVALKVDYKKVSTVVVKKLFKIKPLNLFISQDQQLSFDIYNIANNETELYIKRVNKNDLLESYPMIVGETLDDRPLFSYIPRRAPRIDKISKECYIPVLNDTVYINKKPVKLLQQVGLGGEGKVYLINEDIVAKIYNKQKLTRTRAEKITAMVNKRILDYSICWPIDEIRNKDNFIVGYTMKRCVGKPISTLYRGMTIAKQFYPNYNYKSSVEILLKILYKIKKLHKNNILLGDINDRNFLIDKLENVFLIDTDSFQLEDYCCEVGTIGYIAPELKEGILASSLRTFEDESYAVAVLVFRTLMQGHFPYAQVGSDADYVELIKKQNFPYTTNNNKTKKKAPKIAFEYWSLLPIYLMQMFINTFTGDKKAPAKRYSVDEWIHVLELYLTTIE